jgi:GT2 family glycosyltransferase
MTTAPHELSIVIASYNARSTIAACLSSLAAQTTTAAHEVVVVDSSTDGTDALVARQFPEVRLIHENRRLYPGDARNLGIAKSRGRIIAFMDADCTVAPDWADKLLAVHRAGHDLVASAVDNGSRGSAIAWTYYLCEFNLWLPARGPRTIPEAAGCCLSFAREIFDRYGPFVEGTYCSDTVFHWKLQADGHAVHFAPEMCVAHHHSDTLGSMLRHVFGHRRAFARVSCRSRRLSRLQRLACLLFEPLTPPLLMGAVGLRLRRCPRYLPVFAAVSPLLFLAFAARALGESAGYLRPGPAGGDLGQDAARPIQ